MTRSLMIAAALQMAFATAAFACNDQGGAVIFEDKFADDSGGWDMMLTNVTIVPPAMNIVLSKDTSVGSSLNQTFNATDGVYCQDVVFPPAVPGNILSAGIQFWATDANNLYMFMVGDDGNAGFFKKVNNVWSTVFSGAKVEGFNPAPGTAHELVVQAKAGVLTLSVDGAKIKTIRAQMPTGTLQFGVFTQASIAVDPPVTVQITEFVVTAAQ